MQFPYGQKNDPEQQFRSVTFSDKKRLLNNDAEKQFIEINLGSFGCAKFAPEQDWKRFMTFITIPGDSVKKYEDESHYKNAGARSGMA